MNFDILTSAYEVPSVRFVVMTLWAMGLCIFVVAGASTVISRVIAETVYALVVYPLLAC